MFCFSISYYTHLKSLCSHLFHMAQQNLPSKRGQEGFKKKGGDVSVWKEKTFRNATIFNQPSFWISKGLCFGTFCSEFWYFPSKWHFKADSSSCPTFILPLTHTQQMVQIAWHSFTGSMLGGKPCQTADSFFEDAHSGNNE